MDGGTDPGAATRQERQRYQWFIWALLFFLVVHLVALGTMALMVQPGFDVALPAADRAAYVAEHPWIWRLGWLPWQLSALSDVLISMTLILWLCTRSNRLAWKWALAGLAFNLAASIPEQVGEWQLVTSHIGTATRASQSVSNLELFAQEQNSLLSVVGVWGGFVYLFMTLAWHRALRLGAGIEGWWSGFSGKLVGFLSLALFILAVLTAGQVWLDWEPTLAITVFAGVGFLAVCLWAFVAADLAGQLHHSYPWALGSSTVAGSTVAGPDAAHHLVWPTMGPVSLLAGVLNSRGVRDMTRILPFVKMRSDIHDVVYLNWLIPTEQAQGVLPHPLRCDDLDGLTAVSVLTYKHGSFGPRFLGPLRKMFPSPSQTNWRLYVQPDDSRRAQDSIYFFSTALDSTPHVVGSRLGSDGLPAHRVKTIEHTHTGGPRPIGESNPINGPMQTIRTVIDPGRGSGPRLLATTVDSQAKTLSPAWGERFANWDSAVSYLVEQNASVVVDQGAGVVRESVIAIAVQLKQIRSAIVTELEVSAIPACLLPNATDLSSVLTFVLPEVTLDSIREGVRCTLPDN